jgi:hypothetical protein
MVYHLEKKGNLEFFIFPQLKMKGLVYGFTTKIWNINEIIKNFNFKEDSIISLRQIHSDRFYKIAGKSNKILVGDALITLKQGLLLTVRTADCLPILIFDNREKIIAAIHSGWKGTAKKITLKVLNEIISSNVKVTSLFALLGPCICEKCYEVGENVKEAFENSKEWKNSNYFLVPSDEHNKYYFNLKKANLFQIYEAGIKKKNILSIDLCTKCNPNLFFSYRRKPKTKQRMLAFIGLKNY